MLAFDSSSGLTFKVPIFKAIKSIMPFSTRIDDREGFPIITLKDNSTGTEAEIYAFGALLNTFSVQVNGVSKNIVEGFAGREDVLQHITHGFKSAKLSPFVCRMFDGVYQLKNQTFKVNKHYLNGHAIHGLIYDAVYTITATASDLQKADVTLLYKYAGDDAGYPFPYQVTVNWQLTAANRLTVTTSIINQHTETIPMADGWHPYFTLGGAVDEWAIQFNSTEQLEYDAALLPTGKKITDNRFINGCSLKNIELDNSFALDFSKTPAHCVLQNDQLSLSIDPENSYPLLQLYIPAHRKSIAIENLSGAPDNFNNGIGLIQLLPGQEKIFRTNYQVTILT